MSGRLPKTLGQILEISGNFVIMLILIICRSGSKLVHVRLNTRSLVQNLEKPCVHSRVHSFVSNVMKLCPNVNYHNIYVKFETGTCWVETRSLRQQATQMSDLGPLWPSTYITKQNKRET